MYDLFSRISLTSLIVAVVIIVFSPTIPGTLARVAYTVLFAWAGAISPETYQWIVLNAHW